MGGLNEDEREAKCHADLGMCGSPEHYHRDAVERIIDARVSAALAGVEALAEEWTAEPCQTDGDPCSWHRVSADCAAELRAAIAAARSEQ